MDEHLRFVNRFLGDDELVDLLQAADLYVTPYLTEAQITSGTLAYAVAVGKPVISTPYWHAKEALADGVGVICPFNDTRAFTREIISTAVRRNAAGRHGPARLSRRRTLALAAVLRQKQSDWRLAARAAHDKRIEDSFPRAGAPETGRPHAHV